MVNLVGLFKNVFTTKAFKGADGKDVPARTKVQIEVLENTSTGEHKYELYDLALPFASDKDDDFLFENIGKQVSIPVKVYGEKIKYSFCGKGVEDITPCATSK